MKPYILYIILLYVMLGACRSTRHVETNAHTAVDSTALAMQHTAHSADSLATRVMEQVQTKTDTIWQHVTIYETLYDTAQRVVSEKQTYIDYGRAHNEQQQSKTEEQIQTTENDTTSSISASHLASESESASEEKVTRGGYVSTLIGSILIILLLTIAVLLWYRKKEE